MSLLKITNNLQIKSFSVLCGLKCILYSHFNQDQLNLLCQLIIHFPQRQNPTTSASEQFENTGRNGECALAKSMNVYQFNLPHPKNLLLVTIGHIHYHNLLIKCWMSCSAFFFFFALGGGFNYHFIRMMAPKTSVVNVPQMQFELKSY